jgi:hypothetical protein
MHFGRHLVPALGILIVVVLARNSRKAPPSKTSAFFVKKFKKMVPPCDLCTHYMPHLVSGEAKSHLGRCLLFGDKQVSEYAVHCRRNAHQCGPHGTCFQQNDYLFLQ